MADLQRLEELRRRVLKDPASLAFAQLAEECRRAGHYQEAVRVCREGLSHHPDYLSARVTLGRSLLGLGHLDQASAELSGVLRSAPDHLAALRGLAEVFHMRGMDADALDCYRTALALAPHDAEITAAIDALDHPASPGPAPMATAGPGPAAILHAAAAMPAGAPAVEESPGGAAVSLTGGPTPDPSGRPVTPRRPAATALARLERWLVAIDTRRARGIASADERQERG